MAYEYRTPKSSIVNTDAISLQPETYVGSNFSINNIGGYREVNSISDLDLILTGSPGSDIQLSANTIPIRYAERGLSFLPDTVKLWADGISSGRRKIGMLVYVREDDKTYQYVIPNYETLFNAADSAGSISYNTGDGLYSVTNGTTDGANLLNAWTGSTVEGYNGVTAANARWRIFWGTDWQVTGGTVDYNSTGDLNLNSNSGNTVTISGLKTITGGTYFSGTSTLELYNNLGDTIDITGFSSGDGFTLSGNTTDGLISYGTPSVGIVENNLTFNGDNNTLTLSGDSVTNGVEYQQTESTTTVTNGNHNIYTIPLTSGCTFEYTYFVEENNTGVFRSGKILTSLNNSKTNVVYNDYSTEDGIGSTEDIEFESLISGSNLVLRAVTTNNTQWTIKIKLNVLF